jgi:putative thiamine transport system ATP-binding protein
MALVLEGVSLSLSGKMLLKPFSLSIGAGEIVTLMGPSGAGKSSLLAYVAGDLGPPLEGKGRILLDGSMLNDEPPERRGIGRLFQDDLLFPHMTVADNLLFGMRREAREARLVRMRAALYEAGLGGFENRAPYTLSGGERARVALLRALLARPRAMLLDEPFSRLDAELRQALRVAVFARLRAEAIPVLMVTHDRADAPKDGRVLVITRDGSLRND